MSRIGIGGQTGLRREVPAEREHPVLEKRVPAAYHEVEQLLAVRVQEIRGSFIHGGILSRTGLRTPASRRVALVGCGMLGIAPAVEQ